MNPESILENLKSTYLHLQSYSDVGTVEMVPAASKTPIEFKTYFARPAKVRFEWRDCHPYFGKEHPSYDGVIWSDGQSSNLSFLGQLKAQDQLSLAIAGATGVSRASVHMILKLLLPDCINLNDVWYQMHDARTLDDEQVNNVDCYHLIGTTQNTDDIEAWIGKDDLLVRRLRATTVITEEDSERLHSIILTELKKFGTPAEHMPKQPQPARTYYHEYNYHKVSTNQPLPDDLFNFGPSNPDR